MGRKFLGSLGGGSQAASVAWAKRSSPAAWNVIPPKDAPGARKRSRLGPALAMLAMLGGGYASSVHPTPPVMSSLWSWTAIRDTIPDSDPMPSIGIGAPIPSGYIAFCLSHKSQCDVPLIGDKIIHLDGKAWHEIQQVNADVNESMRTREDKDHYGRAEVWTIPTDGLGDCEDFALTKQKKIGRAHV